MNVILEFFTLPFMQRAILGGVTIAVACSLIGTFMVLRRLSFFGDAIAHASLAGVAIGLLVGVSPFTTAFLAAAFLAVFLYRFSKATNLSTDTAMGFLFSAMIALGVLIIDTLPNHQSELTSLLFGDVLSISWANVIIIFLLGSAVVAGIFHYYQELIFSTFDEESALVSGVKVAKTNLIYHFMLVTAVIISLKLVGVILVNGLLIIPVSTAKLVSQSLRQMFLLSPLFGVNAVLIGLFSAYLFGLSPGPNIVVIATLQFLIVLGIKKALN